MTRSDSVATLRVLAMSVFLLLPSTSVSQDAVQRDPQAIAVLTKSLASLSSAVANDIVATGTVTRTSSTGTDSGTIRVLVRGTGQSAEQIMIGGATEEYVFAAWECSEKKKDGIRRATSLEWAANGLSLILPSVLVTGALQDSDIEIRYMGRETLEGQIVDHVRIRKTYGSTPHLQHLAEFSQKELYLDTNSGLLRKISLYRREFGGAWPKTYYETVFSAYQSQTGVTFPSQIQQSRNGVLWLRIHIEALAVNTGLTDADFPIQ
jgi:hypothetical protein